MCQTNNHKRKRAGKIDGLVRRKLNKYGYPPDKQQAVETAMKQRGKITSRLWKDLRKR